MKFNRKSFFLALFFALFELMGEAGENRWTTNGPLGGGVEYFTFHPTNNKLVFAGPFRSLNGGITWQRMDLSYVFDVKIHPKQPGTVVATDQGRIYSSTNQGATWQKISKLNLPAIEDIEFHTTNPGILYAVTLFEGVFKSSDGGITWVKKSPGLRLCCSLEVDPLNGEVVYATHSNGLYKTTNGGTSWKKLPKTSIEFFSLTIHPHDPNILFAGGFGGGFRSTNAGSTWASVNCGCTSPHFVFDKKNPSVIYSGTNTDVLKSTDAGNSWKPLNFLFPSGGPVGVHPVLNQIVLVAGSVGIYRSINGGASFKIITKKLDNLTLRDVDSEKPGTIFAAGWFLLTSLRAPHRLLQKEL